MITYGLPFSRATEFHGKTGHAVSENNVKSACKWKLANPGMKEWQSGMGRGTHRQM